MSDAHGVANGQQEFRELIRAHWREISGGRSAEANRQSTLADQLVSAWREHSGVGELLLPLLDVGEQPAIRCAAATYLLSTGHSELAEPVLAELAENDDIGLVAEDADLVLERWRGQSDR